MTDQGTLLRIERRIERIEELLGRLVDADFKPINEGVGETATTLINLARQNPAAAIQEAKRLSRLDSEKKRAKNNREAKKKNFKQLEGGRA